MNCVWEVVLKAKKSGYGLEELRFINSQSPSPYTESSFDFLNSDTVENSEIEINPLYRFAMQLGELFLPDVVGYENVRAMFLDVMLHYVAIWDLRSGGDKKELRAMYTLNEIQEGRFLKSMRETLLDLELNKAKRIIFCLLDLYKCKDYITIFRKALKELYPKANLYIHSENLRKLILFTGVDKTKKDMERIEMLKELFLPISYETDIFWKYHFGIVGVKESMKIGKMALY
jgi:hypothetical protein